MRCGMNSKITVGNPQKSEISFLTSILLSHRHFISACECDNKCHLPLATSYFTFVALSLSRAVRAIICLDGPLDAGSFFW